MTMQAVAHIKPEALKIRVLVVDDHPIFRQGIRSILLGEDNIQPIGEVGDIPAALDWLSQNQADVVLLDHNLPGTSGVDGLPKIREVAGDMPVIILSVSDENAVLIKAVRHGACGYMLKDAPPERLLKAINAAASGECLVSEGLTRALFQQISDPGISGPPTPAEGRKTSDDHGPLNGVTPREREILQHLAHGLANKEIARELGISPNTVRNQLQRLQERCHAKNRVQLALLAFSEGLH